MLRGLIFLVLPVFWHGVGGQASADTTEFLFSGFGGEMTNEDWFNIASDPPAIDYQDSYAAGVSLAAQRRTWRNVAYGIEASLLKHFGEQDHWELAVPFYLRTPGWSAVPGAPNLAAGLGLSYATELPEVEIARKGGTDNLMAYWFAELAFGSPDKVEAFFRLHHRSDAFGVFTPDTGSNLFLFGLRRSFDWR